MTALGVLIARLEAIVTLDDDLQNPPEEIAKLLAVRCGHLLRQPGVLA